MAATAAHGAHHDAHDAHATPTGWRRFVYSTNHKDIGTMYLVFAIIGGLVGGVLATLAFANWGRGNAAYGKVGLVGGAGVVAIAVASVAIAYWQVRGLA